jgi:pyruvate kinase
VFRKTKIVATLGPACASAEAVRELIEAGTDVARLNFSHGDHDTHRRLADWVRAAADDLGRPVALLQDIQGPKIRTGSFPGGEVAVAAGSEVTLVPGRGRGDATTIHVDYPRLLEEVAAGGDVLLADGMLRMTVLGVAGDGLRARVEVGGELRDAQGVAFPGARLTTPAVTEKDRNDLEFGREIGVDLIAASFVQSAADIEEVRSIVGTEIPVIAKIERAVAYDNLDEILAASEGVMVARGDLGVEIPLQTIPQVQRDILRRAVEAGKVSITATEMLQSMTEAPRPTRAEVTDVANSVFQGTDAVMLSGETAIGRYPTRAVRAMATICRAAEAGDSSSGTLDFDRIPPHLAFATATARAAVEAALSLGVRAIVAFTESGGTARLLSKMRPAARIFAHTPEPAVHRRLAIVWGVVPVLVERLDSTDEMLRTVDQRLLDDGLAERGESVVIVAGVPPNRRASTNLMKLHRIGAEDL